MIASRARILPVGTRLMVRWGEEHSHGYFPGFVVTYLKDSHGMIERVLIVYERVPGDAMEEYYQHPFPLTMHYEVLGDYNHYLSLPAMDVRIGGKFKVFVIHGIGNVDECGEFEARPSKDDLENLKNASLRKMKTQKFQRDVEYEGANMGRITDCASKSNGSQGPRTKSCQVM